MIIIRFMVGLIIFLFFFILHVYGRPIFIRLQVQMCLKKVGSFLHTVQIEPISEYYNLFEFVRIWNLFMEYHVEHGRGNPMDGLENFYFTFCCENRDQSEVSIYGTGKSDLISDNSQENLIKRVRIHV